ncbi:phosphoglycerate kinase [Candidatus Omnitrophota bacterium]
MKKKTINDIDINGKRVFMRCDFNVPLDKALNITDDARIQKALPTIKYAVEQGAKVILASHLGRPKGERIPEYSLKPVSEHLSKLLGKEVTQLDDCIGEKVQAAVDGMNDGDVILLENVRYYKGETKNDEELSKSFAALADVYVNDAFGTAHRAHASTEGITKFKDIAVSGFLLAKEIEYFDKALSSPDKPFVAILGGAKVSDKITVIENLLEKVDAILIGGGMAYTFLKVKGIAIGNSKCEDEAGQKVAEDVLAKAQAKGVSIHLPVDHVVGNEFSENADAKVTEGEAIEDGWMGLDIGPKTIEAFTQVLASAKTVIWNGPVGVFEFDKFEKGSKVLAEFIGSLDAISIIGGGDTAAAIKKFDLEDKMSHISTGGGASLEYLEGKVLPGVAALNDK